MKNSRKTSVACASLHATSRAIRLAIAPAVLLVLAACGARDEAPVPAVPSPPPRAILAVKDAWARSADSGAMTAVYFTITNAAAVSDTLASVRSTAAEEAGLHMSMQQGGTMHMAALQSLPVPADDSVVFAPLGAHVMLTRMTRRVVIGDTIPLTLSFVSGQSIEVRAGVRQP